MKLFFCITCNQIFKVADYYQECNGAHGGAQYINDIDAKVWGNPDQIFILGFANSTLASAIRNQIKDGDLPADFGYGGKIVSKGREFTAFVIPESAPSIERVPDKF